MAFTNKYDRQLRIWGPLGQQKLEKSRICMFGCEPAGVETLKNLILPGCGHITIVDDKLVTDRDCGNNFFVTLDSVGKNRAEVVAANLLEMNEDVKGKAVPKSLKECFVPEFIRDHDLFIANNLELGDQLLLADICQKEGRSLCVLQTEGLIGRIRLFTAEKHCGKAKLTRLANILASD